MNFNEKKISEIVKKQNTICSLNNNSGNCLSPIIIKKIFSNVIDKEKEENDSNSINMLPENIIINKIAKHYKCPFNKNKELCIINSVENNVINEETKNIIKFKSFKPFSKRFDGNYWLNNSHIDDIQEQLYKLYPNYYYSFIHMIDLGMIPPNNFEFINHKIIQLTDINFSDELSNGTNLNETGKLKYFGVVINTDTSDGSGKHWFAIFCNFNTCGTNENPYVIEYFNSSGYNIESIDFQKFWMKVALDISFNTKKNCIFKKVSNIKHQNATTGNCGVFACFYIWCRLEGVSMEYFNNPSNIITDDKMENFRKVLFREEI